jgi:hypothetical protein
MLRIVAFLGTGQAHDCCSARQVAFGTTELRPLGEQKMSAIATHKAQRLPIECASSPKPGLAAYGVIGLVITYIIVLALAMVENLSVEKFEAIMNVTAIAGFVILWGAFWKSSRDDASGRLCPDARRVPSADLRETTNKADSPSMGHWGPPSTIGSLSE